MTEAFGNSFIPRRGRYIYQETMCRDTYMLDIPGTMERKIQSEAYFVVALGYLKDLIYARTVMNRVCPS